MKTHLILASAVLCINCTYAAVPQSAQPAPMIAPTTNLTPVVLEGIVVTPTRTYTASEWRNRQQARRNTSRRHLLLVQQFPQLPHFPSSNWNRWLKSLSPFS